MGVDKALMKINGMTLLEIAVQNLENSGVESIHVLVKDGSQADIYRNRLGERVSFHLDPLDTKGPWEALVAMLQQLNDKEIVQLLPVDTPWFDDIAIDLLQEKMKHTPEIKVSIVESSLPPAGIAEAVVAPVIPSITNAIFAATGKRIRKLPIGKQKLV